MKIYSNRARNFLTKNKRSTGPNKTSGQRQIFVPARDQGNVSRRPLLCHQNELLFKQDSPRSASSVYKPTSFNAVETMSHNGNNGAGLSLNHTVGKRKEAFHYRNQLKQAGRVVIKMGSSVVTRDDDNGLALGRLASIIEQVAELQNEGRDCILITSGAVAFGKQKLAQELMMSMSMRDTIHKNISKDEDYHALKKEKLNKPNAAVGQSGLQALYETMFRNYGIIVGQVLVTNSDFSNEHTRSQLFSTIDELLQLNIIPIINTNDAVSPPQKVVEAAASRIQYNSTKRRGFDERRGATKQDNDYAVNFHNTDSNSLDDTAEMIEVVDNDSLAARIAVENRAELLILMTNVDGIMDKPPSNIEESRIIHTFNPRDARTISLGDCSKNGTGGMESKIKAALWALDHGSSVVVCNGMSFNTIRKTMSGNKIGTFFTKAEVEDIPVEILARNARSSSRKLKTLEPFKRAEIIQTIADSLQSRAEELLRHNQQDLLIARQEGIVGPMYSRLEMTPKKIGTLVSGLHQIAKSSHHNVGKILRQIKVSESIDLVQKTTPIGLLLVIFESRPDCLPQLAALSIASANGLLVKGGREAYHTNSFIMSLVKHALRKFDCEDSISMVSTREAISDLLKMDMYIDLIISRGSGDMVRSIREQSRTIPVLGHAEGICHVYIDSNADIEKAANIVKDSKVGYPAACNSMETLLVHEDLVHTSKFNELCSMLQENDVKLYSGPRLGKQLIFGPPPAQSLKMEYGDLRCTIECVSDTDEAIKHINRFGSGHTDVIVSSDEGNIERFQNRVDSACVFANCSTRMSDGYRFGLGAEVGISTGRIHARGPVGVEGLLTTKWVMTGTDETAEQYDNGRKTFLHQHIFQPGQSSSVVENDSGTIEDEKEE